MFPSGIVHTGMLLNQALGTMLWKGATDVGQGTGLPSISNKHA